LCFLISGISILQKSRVVPKKVTMCKQPYSYLSSTTGIIQIIGGRHKNFKDPSQDLSISQKCS
jgi:hypothetical protein